MSTFKSSEQFLEILGGFFHQLAQNSKVTEKLLSSKIVIRFTYTDPDAVILVDCSGEEMDIRTNDTETQAIVEMSMSADIAHKFWFGKVNLARALTRRQMIAKGPIAKILKLLPAIKPAYALYPQYLEENNYSEFNIY